MTSTNSKPRISLLHSYFKPAFKAGDTVQSMYNLCALLADEYELQVICVNHDLNEQRLYSFIDQKITYIDESYASVAYVSETSSVAEITNIIQTFAPDYVYIRDLNRMRFFLSGWRSVLKSKANLVVAPGEILHPGSRQKNTILVSAYLLYLKSLLLLVRNKRWQATDQQELRAIKKWFGRREPAFIAPNILRPLPVMQTFPTKQKRELRLVYYSSITGRKNLILLLRSLARLNFPVSLDIYGPATERNYWDKCERLIDEMPRNVTVLYYGSTTYENFAKEAHRYHFMILLSRGEYWENVVYEAMSLALPAIVSRFTSWKFSNEKEGFYVDLEEKHICVLLTELYKMDEAAYTAVSTQARNYAEQYYLNNAANYKDEYQALFS